MNRTRWFWVLLGSAVGCGGGTASEPETTQSDAGAETYRGSAAWCDVKRTLDARCVACHDDQRSANAPMSLLTYAHTQAAAFSDPSRKVYELIGARVHDTAKPMPPQQKLTAAELAEIDTWVAAGAPAGDDPSCGSSPPVVSTPDEWPTNCDATYIISAHAPGADAQPFSVPAGRELHSNVTVPAPWGNEALQAIAFRPITDNRKVLHHWILYGPKHEFLVGWAPGKDNTVLPADVGMNLSGGTLSLNMHYNNLLGSQAELDQSGVEICALKPASFRKHTAAVHTGFSRLAFNIPARAVGYEVTGQCTATVSTPVTVFSASPHAHRLAHHMSFSVQKKSGERIVMFDSSFDFEEQQVYPLSPTVTLETGDKVITTCSYDNTSDRAVKFGEDTDDEMCFNFASYYPMGALTCGIMF
jgi:hypothetical protein